MDELAISADSHIVEPKQVFDTLERRFGERAPIVRWDDARGDVMSTPPERGRGGGFPVGRLGIAGARLDNPETQALIKRGYAGLRPGIADPARRHEDQDADGVSCELLFPSLYFSVFRMEDAEVQLAAFQVYNDWLADYCAAQPDRLIGLALLPAFDAAASVAELQRVLRLGYRGVCLPCTPPKGRLYSERDYDPMWSALQESGVPVNFHIFTAGQPANDLAASGPIAAYASAATIIQATATDLICGGVAHRYPRIKFVLAEWEAGWLAQWLERLDHAFYRSRSAAPAELDLQPREYWARQFYATFEDDRFGVITRSGIGVETLLWANDFPHHDSIWPHSREVWADIMAEVPSAEREAMLYANVSKLYGIETPVKAAAG